MLNYKCYYVELYGVIFFQFYWCEKINDIEIIELNLNSQHYEYHLGYSFQYN